MDDRQAFWRALGLVVLPSLLVWVGVGCWYVMHLDRTESAWDAIGLFIFLALLPLPLAAWYYLRFRKGLTLEANMKSQTPGKIILSTVIFALMAVFSAWGKYPSSTPVRLLFILSYGGLSLVYLVRALNKIREARKAAQP